MDIEEIKSVLNGTASSALKEEVQEYLDNGDISEFEVHLANEWNAHSDLDQDLPKKISRNMLGNISGEIQKAKVPSIYNLMKYTAIAASIVLLISCLFFLTRESKTEMLTYNTDYGDWKYLELPDGSNVSLNADSELRFESTWASNEERIVWLKGEAFFEVENRHEEKVKFKVMTEGLAVEVYGTTFNVRSRNDKTHVYLKEGEIKLTSDQGIEEILKPGDFISYSKKQHQIIDRKEREDAEQYASWKDGILVLKDQKVSVILDKLKEIYGVSFQMNNLELAEEIKTISLPMNEINIVIPVLEAILARDIEINEKELIVH
ncbi:MAG: transmembrane sensor [Saprospiraceae bacterium]|jgi:transmembrane sensor